MDQSSIMKWLDTLKFENAHLRVVFQEYYHQLKELEQRIVRLEKEIRIQATEGVHAPKIQALTSTKRSSAYYCDKYCGGNRFF